MSLKIWSVQQGQELLTLRGHGGHVWEVAFSPDGHRIATADNQGIIKGWDGTPVSVECHEDPRSIHAGFKRSPVDLSKTIISVVQERPHDAT